MRYYLASIVFNQPVAVRRTCAEWYRERLANGSRWVHSRPADPRQAAHVALLATDGIVSARIGRGDA